MLHVAVAGSKIRTDAPRKPSCPGQSGRNSSTLPTPPRIGQHMHSAPNRSHSSEFRSRVRRRSLSMCQEPTRKSKSCAPPVSPRNVTACTASVVANFNDRSSYSMATILGVNEDETSPVTCGEFASTIRNCRMFRADPRLEAAILPELLDMRELTHDYHPN